MRDRRELPDRDRDRDEHRDGGHERGRDRRPGRDHEGVVAGAHRHGRAGEGVRRIRCGDRWFRPDAGAGDRNERGDRDLQCRWRRLRLLDQRDACRWRRSRAA